MSELCYTTSGTPFIKLVDDADKEYGTFIFSKITSTSKGYKYLCFTHRYTNQIATKHGKGNAARTKFAAVDVADSYVFNMRLKRDDAGKKGVPQGMMPRRLADWIIDTLDEFLVDGIFPYSRIPALEPIFAALDIDKVIVTDAQRKRKANAAKRLQKKKDALAKKEMAEVEEKIIRDDYRETGGAIDVKVTQTIKLSEIF